MTIDATLHIVSKLFWTALLVCGPILAATMLVGIAISVVQVVTQIHDTSLTFVPKLLIAGVTLLMFGAWMLRRLSQYATELWSSIPSLF